MAHRVPRLVALISARGLKKGIEIANKIRAPALLVLLLILVAYSLATGDVRRGLSRAKAVVATIAAC